MYWILLCALAAHFVSGHHGRDSKLFEEVYRRDSDEADAITYQRDNNTHVDINNDHDMSKYVNYIHKREHEFTKHFQPNKTIHENDHAAIHALRSKHKDRCESGVLSIIEKTAHCQLCTCFKGQWVCMFVTSCYYKYDFSNKLCTKPNADKVKVYFQRSCYVCTCEDSTHLLQCIKNPVKLRNKYCRTQAKRDILGGIP